jgi:hypothetical protein
MQKYFLFLSLLQVEKLRRTALELGHEKEGLHTVLDMLVQSEQLDALGLSPLEKYEKIFEEIKFNKIQNNFLGLRKNEGPAGLH